MPVSTVAVSIPKDDFTDISLPDQIDQPMKLYWELKNTDTDADEVVAAGDFILTGGI